MKAPSSPPCSVEDGVLNCDVKTVDATRQLFFGHGPSSSEAEQRFGKLIGTSPAMLRLFAHLERLAQTDANLLIQGEFGTSKQAAALSVHEASRRRAGPFVVFDCEKIPSPLLYVELFGSQVGAVGSAPERPGVLEQAHSGTLFLNRVDDLPLQTQGELLDALQSLSLRRLGARESVPIDVRIIATANENLREAVDREEFRKELYFKIAVSRATLPPIRERLADLPLLINHFIALQKPELVSTSVPKHILEVFEAYHWPGNDAELERAVHHFITHPAPPTTESDKALAPLRLARRSAIREFEVQYLASLLASTNGNVTRAAAVAKISRQMLQRLLRKYGVNSKSAIETLQSIDLHLERRSV